MSCTLAIFCLSNLYVNLEVTQPRFSMSHPDGSWCDGHLCRGPLAEVRLGMKLEVSDSMVIDYGFKHASFISESTDVGQNIPFVTLTWRPFK